MLFSEVWNANITHRCDPEFFSKMAIHTEKFITQQDHFFLDVKQVVSGPFGSTLKSSSYLKAGDIAFVRIEDIKGGFHINRSNMVYISDSDNRNISNSQLYTDDLILSKVGNSIGFFARVDDEIKTCNISENNIGIKLSAFVPVKRHVILAYLNSKYGQVLLLRRRSGNAQPKLNVDDVCFIPIPNFNDQFSKIISKLILNSDRLIRESRLTYQIAEQVLTKRLGCNNVVLRADAISSKYYSESFGLTGRLDAEYYQPKYESYAESLHTEDTVSSLCHIYDDNFLPHAKEKYRYIELANVGTHGNISDLELQNGNELPSRARRRVKAGQVIVSSIEGSLQSCALITDELDGAICSTGFYVVDSDKINSETLLVLFKLEPIQALMKQRCSGTILTAIPKGEFLSMSLPEIDTAIQNEIAQKVQQSFALRRDAEKLIDIAVKAVEIAIEENESAAIDWVQKQVGETSMEDR